MERLADEVPDVAVGAGTDGWVDDQQRVLVELAGVLRPLVERLRVTTAGRLS